VARVKLARAGAALVAIAACGGKAAVEDTRATGSSASSGSSSGSGGGSSAGASKGDAQIRVEWREPPAALRASPGRDACGLARPPVVAPTSTWGIPDVAVWLDVAASGSAQAAPVRVVLAPCAVSPRIAVAHPGAALQIASAIEQPVEATVMHYGAPDKPGALAGIITATALPVGAITRLQLPVIGHAVSLALAAPAVDAVTAGDGGGGAAWVLTVPGAAGVTDASGQVVLRELPVGAHAVTAWLPSRDRADMQLARGTVDVLPGGLAEVTLAFGSAAAAAPANAP
jgi:hypothetical protein